MRKLLFALLFVACSAEAATAYLASQRVGISVTGQSIVICTYRYGATVFDRVFPLGSMCPMSVEVQ